MNMSGSGVTAARGRPRRSSRAILEEAAFELFLEQGYSSTTVDEIANRAGVSRNTFFNYFESKSDVFWVDIDRALATLQTHIADTDQSLPTVERIHKTFVATAKELGPGVVPWILTNFDAIGRPAEVMESALRRLAHANSLLRDIGTTHSPNNSSQLMPQLIVNTTLAALVSAALAWGAAGVQRDTFEAYLQRAITPLAHAFAEAR